LEQITEIAEALGLKFHPEWGRSVRKLNDFLEGIADKPTAMVRSVHFLLLRSLKQAVYDVVNVGHFALGTADYLHFTSPIRRYPDLVVHRLLKHVLHGDGQAAGGPPSPPPDRPTLVQMAVQSSTCERRAMEVEREAVDMYRAHLMRDRVG